MGSVGGFCLCQGLSETSEITIFYLSLPPRAISCSVPCLQAGDGGAHPFTRLEKMDRCSAAGLDLGIIPAGFALRLH